MNKITSTILIKSEASRLGFNYCGISKAEHLEEEARRLEMWLNKGMHGKMKYMENHFDLRVDPTRLVPGAKSVISLLYNYYNNETLLDKEEPKISKYAFGKDYHFVIKEKLYQLFESIKEKIGAINGRVFVDSGPVLERAWAEKSGLGWIGRNGNLINKESGSFYFPAEIILDLELEYDSPVKDYCGSCTRCVDACPTDAIFGDKGVDGSKCISYFTIELRDQIPDEMHEKFKGWMFGCDICQDVCPWNRFAKQHEEKQFLPSAELLGMKKNNWEELTEEVFQSVFKDSPLRRAKFEGIKRNVRFLNLEKVK
ncbi:MAG: tRNA epoxyqueuosine(34) reductase QueG [Chitinophagales bacterium]|nr:tRNA epoxyqueuosine(34) reductase QueG [Chitinophagales bacterium]